jgi:hypothetical protein
MLDRGHVSHVDIFEPLYNNLTPGTPLKVRIWRGKICLLRYQGQTYRTADNSDSIGPNFDYTAIVVLIVYYLGGFACNMLAGHRICCIKYPK